MQSPALKHSFLVRNHVSFSSLVCLITLAGRKMLTRLLTLQFTITGCARLLKAKALARDMLLAPTDQSDQHCNNKYLTWDCSLRELREFSFSTHIGSVTAAARTKNHGVSSSLVFVIKPNWP